MTTVMTVMAVREATPLLIAVAMGALVVVVGFLTIAASREPSIQAHPLHVGARMEDAFNILVVANTRDFPEGPYSSDDNGPFHAQVASQLSALLELESPDKSVMLSAYREQLNFWISNETAALESSSAVCISHDYRYQRLMMDGDGPAFHPDAVVIFHTRDYQDCAAGRVATARLGSNPRLVHELSHMLFGLPDEYCCDGRYFELPPILFASARACQAIHGQDGCSQLRHRYFDYYRESVEYWHPRGVPDVMVDPDFTHQIDPKKKPQIEKTFQTAID